MFPLQHIDYNFPFDKQKAIFLFAWWYITVAVLSFFKFIWFVKKC